MRHTLNENILYVTRRDIKNLVEESLRRLSLLLEYNQLEIEMPNGIRVKVTSRKQERDARETANQARIMMKEGDKEGAEQKIRDFMVRWKLIEPPPSTQPAGKRRGRPPGSKNKPKVPMPATPNVTIAPPQPQLPDQPQPVKRGRKKGSLNLKTLYDIRTLKTSTGVQANIAMDIPNVDTEPRKIAYYIKRFVHDEFLDDLVNFFKDRKYKQITSLYKPMEGEYMFRMLKDAMDEMDRIVDKDMPYSTSKEYCPVSPYGFLGDIAIQLKIVVKAIIDMTERTKALKVNGQLNMNTLNGMFKGRTTKRFVGLIIANPKVASEYVKILNQKIDYLEKKSGLSTDSSQNPIK